MRTRLIPFLLSLALPALALAQSAAFTYQGRLNDTGAPANGLHDFRFKLFDAASGGTQVGTTLCVDNLQVTAGLFSATLDFGNQFKTPVPRFIEIEVRRDTGLDCTNVGGFVLLSPRQAITPTPTASHATSAFSLDAANGSIANAVFVDNAGRVGVGTLAPTHSLHIANPAPTIAIQDTDSTTQQVGYVSYRDSGNVERAWVGYGSAGDPNFSIVNTRTGGDIVLLPFAGNVGINNSVPLSALDVHGDIRLGPSGQFRATSSEENLRIIRGQFTTNGTVTIGTGFSVSRVAEGQYTVTFTTPFSDRPVVTAMTTVISGDPVSFVQNRALASAGIAAFNVVRRDNGSTVDGIVDFIAIGPR